MKKLLLFSVIILSAFACKTQKGGKCTIKDDFKVVYYQTGCRGNCPDFRVTVDKEGNVMYFGNNAVDKMGYWEKKLPEATLCDITKVMDQAGYWEFAEEYGGGVADLPSIWLEFSHDSKAHKVHDIREAPENLKALEKKVADLIDLENGYKKSEDQSPKW